MGLLQTLRENREQTQIRKQHRLARQEQARVKAQAAYDIEYERAAAKAVKGRARRDAMDRFGHSKGEKRMRALGNMGRELESLGNWAAGNQPSRSKTSSHRKKSSHHKKQTSRRKEEDPFDMSDLDDLLS